MTWTIEKGLRLHILEKLKVKPAAVVAMYLAISIVLMALTQQAEAAGPSPLARRYRSGEQVRYLMFGRQASQDEVHTYSLVSNATVQKAQDEVFVEPTRWNDLICDGQLISLDPQSQAYRESLSLDPSFNPLSHLPDERGIDARLFAPADDLFNFYVDLWLGTRLPMLRKTGDHFYLKSGQTVTFMDGQGQDCFDFDLKLKSVDEAAGQAVLDVDHVAPAKVCVDLPAAWMRLPVVEDRPNNLRIIEPKAHGTFAVTVGNETISIELKVRIGSGQILSADEIDSFRLIERICHDPALTVCEDSMPANSRRDIHQFAIW